MFGFKMMSSMCRVFLEKVSLTYRPPSLISLLVYGFCKKPKKESYKQEFHWLRWSRCRVQESEWSEKWLWASLQWTRCGRARSWAGTCHGLCLDRLHEMTFQTDRNLYHRLESSFVCFFCTFKIADILTYS